MILLMLLAVTIFTGQVQGQCAITNAAIQLDTSPTPQLADRDNLVLVIEGITTGTQATSVTWRWNGNIVNRHTSVAGGGSFYDGGGETIVGTGPCESQMYRVALQVNGRLPGRYTYTVNNTDTPTPMTSPVFQIEEPDPPTNIVLRQISNRRVQATWTPPAGFSGTTYRVYLNTMDVINGGSPVTDGTTYTTTPFYVGYITTFRVRATTGTYLSVPAVSATLTVRDVLAPVITATVTAISATLSLSQPTNSLPVDMYTATLTSTTCTGVPTRTGSSTSNSVTIGSLEAGIQYSVSVTGRNNTAELTGTATTTLTTTETTPSGSPGVPNATVIMSTNITLTWTEIDCVDRNGIITSYMIQYGEGTTRDRTINTQSSTTTHVITGLKPFTQYTFTIAGMNSAGTGTFSSASGMIRTAEETPSGSPGIVNASNITSTSITLTWMEIIDSERNGIITNYLIQYGEGNNTNRTINIQSNATTHVVTGLNPFTQYTFTVAGVNSVGTGPPSYLIIGTNEDAPSGHPGIPVAIEIMSTNITLNWMEIEVSKRNGIITSYIIQYGKRDNRNTTITAISNVTTHVITGLTPFTHYTFSVAGVNSVGTGPFSDYNRNITTAEDRPSGVRNITVEPKLFSVILTWNAPEQINGIVTHYTIQYLINTNVSIINTSDNRTSYFISDLNPNTLVYNIAISATTGGGEGPLVMWRNVTTLDRPGQVTNIVTEVVTESSIRVSWDKSKDVGVTEFIIYFRQSGDTGMNEKNVTVKASVNSVVVMNLVPGSEYVFEVVAVAMVDGMLVKGTRATSRPLVLMKINFSILPVGAIAGGCIGALVLITVVILVAFLLYFYRAKFQLGYSKSKVSVLGYHLSSSDSIMENTDKQQAPYIQEFPSHTKAIEGEEVIFKVLVSGKPTPTLTWKSGEKELFSNYSMTVGDDGTLSFPSTEMDQSGVYTLEARNSAGKAEREVKLVVNRECEESISSGNQVQTIKAIPVDQFGMYVSENHSNNNVRYKVQYESLYAGEDKSRMIGLSPQFKKLNRFGNITVYDDNRIELAPISGHDDCQGSYINACYIQGYSRSKKFIATQGPTPRTLVDFWRLIWQERPPIIVMVTNLKEGNKTKCEQYWPETGSMSFGPFKVTIIENMILADFTIRTLQVHLEGGPSPFKLTQFHYTSWPDHGVPEYASPMLEFHRRVQSSYKRKKGPILVHCSAGVGRTGTFICIDNTLEQIKKENVVDIAGAITKLRHQRMKMVQTVDQYVFLHDATLEAVRCGDTQISAANLRVVLHRYSKKDPKTGQTTYESQFDVLEQVSPKFSEVMCITASKYPEQNRSTKYLPSDHVRVILTGEEHDYIHAVFAHGYKQQKAYIIAENPMDITVSNMFKVLCTRKIGAVVMLSALEENRQEACARYWPSLNEVIQIGDFEIDLISEEVLNGFTVRNISILPTQTRKAHQVMQFHITCWQPDGQCSNLRSVVDTIEEVAKVQRKTGNKPVFVHCSDTVTRSGMFCALSTIIDRCKTEGVVDVFQVVKALRNQKPGAVPTVHDYQTIFEATLMFLDSFDTYANFQN